MTTKEELYQVVTILMRIGCEDDCINSDNDCDICDLYSRAEKVLSKYR